MCTVSPDSFETTQALDSINSPKDVSSAIPINIENIICPCGEIKNLLASALHPWTYALFFAGFSSLSTTCCNGKTRAGITCNILSNHVTNQRLHTSSDYEPSLVSFWTRVGNPQERDEARKRYVESSRKPRVVSHPHHDFRHTPTNCNDS